MMIIRCCQQCISVRNSRVRFQLTNGSHMILRCYSSTNNSISEEVDRIQRIRNVGVLAHVDAGKTTVTERMLALAGAVTRAGSVDLGNTVTDFLPAERERGITIQSAAVSFLWGQDNTNIHLIDTPGHVDFSVEVNRCVAVLDGAVLVVDAVAGVQAQTETVWKALRNTTANPSTMNSKQHHHNHHHEPLPCVALINKMDKEGCNFYQAIQSLKHKLKGSNPVPIQLPLFWANDPTSNNKKKNSGTTKEDFKIIPFVENEDNPNSHTGPFAGIVDLVHMRMVLWPDNVNVSDVDECRPTITTILDDDQIATAAIQSRAQLVARLAEVDSEMEDLFLLEQEPTSSQLQHAIRRATLNRYLVPVLAGAALRGKGVEPVLDAISQFLPSPLDRLPPALITTSSSLIHKKRKQQNIKNQQRQQQQSAVKLGHPLHPSLLAMAFKVVHMKGRGGSGDGRVVFARVYSGTLQTKDNVRCITPTFRMEQNTNMTNTNSANRPRVERVGAMLELSGGKFDNLENGICKSGDVCALVGLKSVVTGDTLLLASEVNNNNTNDMVCLAGVASPKPVLTIRLEAESSEQQTKLSKALQCLAIEDPSLLVEETESVTLLSGLGELHMEVTLDRLKREYGLEGLTFGQPAVSYRETVLHRIETDGMFHYDRSVGGTRLEASIHLILEPDDDDDDDENNEDDSSSSSRVFTLRDPTIIIGPEARSFMKVDEFATESELMYLSEVSKGLISGIKGALRRGFIGPYSMGNVKCTVLNIDAEGGLKSLEALPGSIRAAAANAIASVLSNTNNKAAIVVMEPIMAVEVTCSSTMVGPVLSDLNTRRGSIGDIVSSLGGDDACTDHQDGKSVIRGDVPLIEILGYATALRSLTGGEGAFTAEYVGHAPCVIPPQRNH